MSKVKDTRNLRGKKARNPKKTDQSEKNRKKTFRELLKFFITWAPVIIKWFQGI